MSFSYDSQRKDKTDWALKSAWGFGVDWMGGAVNIGGIACRWKKDVEVTTTYTLTTKYTCLGICIECGDIKYYYYPGADDIYSYTINYTDTEKMELEGSWGYSVELPIGNKVLGMILDTALISNAEREKCNQMKPSGV